MSEINYRELYFSMFFEVSKTIDQLIHILQQNEEVHMKQTEITDFPPRPEPKPEK